MRHTTTEDVTSVQVQCVMNICHHVQLVIGMYAKYVPTNASVVIGDSAMGKKIIS